MTEPLMFVLLAVVFGLGVLLGTAGLRHRSWGLLLLGVCTSAMPMGFASIAMATP